MRAMGRGDVRLSNEQCSIEVVVAQLEMGRKNAERRGCYCISSIVG
jgi:hypothetical protein